MKLLLLSLTLIVLTACGGSGGKSDKTAQPAPLVNVAPTANFNFACTNLECTFTDSSTDSDGSIVSYVWDFGDSSTSTDASPTHAYAIDGDYSVKLTVTDDDSATASDTASITIDPVNIPPVADAGNDQIVYEKIQMKLSGSGKDTDGSITRYSWLQIDGEPVTIESSNNATAIINTPETAVQLNLNFQLMVTDNKGATHSDNVKITIKPVAIIRPEYSNEFDEKYYVDKYSVLTALSSDGHIGYEHDASGIRLWNSGSLVKTYHPTLIAGMCIGYFGGYALTNNNIYKDIVLVHADWLVENQIVTTKGFSIWQLDHTNKAFGADSPWISAMTQGRVISALLRAYQLSGDPKYIKTAESALLSFDYPIEEGGVSVTDAEGNIWYEEVAVVPPAHILNGFIFSLYGLYDYYRVMGDQHSYDLFYAGISTLLNNLDKYETGGVSRYDLLLRGQRFRFINTQGRTSWIHPIDNASLTIDEESTELDIGTEGDNTFRLTGSYLWDDNVQVMDWGQPYNLDGKTVRDYFANPDATYQHAIFKIKLPKDIPWGVKDVPVTFKIHRKDISPENIIIELFDGDKYHPIGTLIGNESNQWVSDEFTFLSDKLRFGGLLSKKYHDVVVKQLLGLFYITGNVNFLEISENWAEQYTTPD